MSTKKIQILGKINGQQFVAQDVAPEDTSVLWIDTLDNSSDATDLITVDLEGSNQGEAAGIDADTFGGYTTDDFVMYVGDDKTSYNTTVQNVNVLLENVNELNTQISRKAESTVYTATLPSSSWSDTVPYTQTITVDGILATDNPFVDVYLSGVSGGIDIIESWCCVSRIVTFDNSLTAYCYSDKPSVDIPIIVKVVR